MRIVIKNYFRNTMANLTIRSIRHFIPDADIWVMCLYKFSASEYDTQEPLLVDSAKVMYSPTKYHGIWPSVAYISNNLLFSEGYNLIWDRFRDYQGKILMIAEDHFFTTGATLNELVKSEFDVAYAHWGHGTNGANGSLLCFKPMLLNHVYPIPEHHTTVEHVLKNWIDSARVRVHRLSTRDSENYHGDGIYTNNAEEMKAKMVEAGILVN